MNEIKLPELRQLVPGFEILVDVLSPRRTRSSKTDRWTRSPKVVLWALRDARQVRRLFRHLNNWAGEDHS